MGDVRHGRGPALSGEHHQFGTSEQLCCYWAHYDGQGGDADIVVSPPTRHGFFQPEEIAVQVKWKQGVDVHDTDAVAQIVKWAASQESNAAKYVISSASEFTEKAKEQAAEKEVVLIGGLQTMCFLLGVSERYREDWEFEA